MEYLFFPQTTFRVESKSYKYCTSGSSSTPEEEICSDTQKDGSKRYTIVELTEIDTPADTYEIVDRPSPPVTPSPKPSGKSSSSADQKEANALGIEYCPMAVLGDFPINEVYVGASSLVNFPMASSVMTKMRRVLGKIVPPPNLQHTAVWVGERADSDEAMGATVVYGEYYSVGDDPTFLRHDGARAYVSSLREFKEDFDAFEVMKMRPGRNMTLMPFLKEASESGNWKALDYSWATNNCQHFTAKCAKILKLKRQNPGKYDWTELSATVLDVLQNNEKVIE